MKLYIIRHGATKGNREHRYVGTTDEGLLGETCTGLKKRRREMFLPKEGRVYVSPLCRCMETARILLPDREYIAVEEFRECDFGQFEYRNYKELNGNPDYQKFVNSWGRCGFPSGESREQFQDRCIRGFEKILPNIMNDSQDTVFVVHGGTIMALLHKYSFPHRDYYEWQADNGKGYVGDLVLTDEGVQIRNISGI